MTGDDDDYFGFGVRRRRRGRGRRFGRKPESETRRRQRKESRDRLKGAKWAHTDTHFQQATTNYDNDNNNKQERLNQTRRPV